MLSNLFLPILLALLVAPVPVLNWDAGHGGEAWADDDDDDGRQGLGGEASADDDDDDGRQGLGGEAWGDDDDDDGRRGRGDDDDDGGDDDDDDAGATGGSGPVGPPPVPAPPPPLVAPGEIVAYGLSAADYRVLLAQGFVLIEERPVAVLGTTLRRLQVPPGVPLGEALSAVRALPSGRDADLNHYYRSEQSGPAGCIGQHCPAFAQIAWPLAPSRQNACGEDIALGMVDTAINGDHAAFLGSRLELHRLADAAVDPSEPVHGTAVAALLVGDPAGRTPGLVAHARLVAVDVFSRAGADERADAFSLVSALGLLADEDVRVINLSLAGPPNAVLERTVAELTGRLAVTLVAAAGNAGPQAAPLFPAAYDGVIAVTAVDRGGTAYRRAGRGPHIDLAAPGVEVWAAASISGGRPKTGTSFAAPFVSAAALLVLQQDPAMTPSEVAAILAAGARDLGATGRDETYGDGLVWLEGQCAKPLPATSTGD